MRRAPVFLALAAALAAAGCNRSQTVQVPGRTVAIAVTDYRYEPQRVQLPKGRLRFTVRNTGRLPHNFQLRGRGAKRGRIATLQPGESGSLTVRLRRGSYTMYCGIGHHEELGEYGTVIVR